MGIELISIALPTGKGKEGVNKETLLVVKNILKTVSYTNEIFETYGQFRLAHPIYTYSHIITWGFVISTYVENKEELEVIFKDLGYNVLPIQLT